MGFLDALAFLTRLPVARERDGGRPTDDLVRAAVWFPVVGALLGAGLLLLGGLLSGWSSVLVAATLVVTLEQLLTGALHLDGLADLADAAGGRDRASRLRIMKDHATGVYGTAAVVLALLLEVGLLAELLPPPSGTVTWSGPTSLLASAPDWVTLTLLGAATWSLSRAAMLPVALTLTYAREEGTGRGVVEGLALRHTLLAWVVPVVLCLMLGWTGLAMLAGVLLAALLVGLHARRTLGGATGDVLGATAQVALLTALLAASTTL